VRILCTNDDGILAYGLECLVRAAKEIGDVTVVAPDREQSATSHSLTLHHPLRPVLRGPKRFQVDGTPTDCVMLAVEALMPERPSPATRSCAGCVRWWRWPRAWRRPSTS
jgi:5'-nucleotidase